MSGPSVHRVRVNRTPYRANLNKTRREIWPSSCRPSHDYEIAVVKAGAVNCIVWPQFVNVHVSREIGQAHLMGRRGASSRRDRPYPASSLVIHPCTMLRVLGED